MNRAAPLLLVLAIASCRKPYAPAPTATPKPTVRVGRQAPPRRVPEQLLDHTSGSCRVTVTRNPDAHAYASRDLIPGATTDATREAYNGDPDAAWCPDTRCSSEQIAGAVLHTGDMPGDLVVGAAAVRIGSGGFLVFENILPVMRELTCVPRLDVHHQAHANVSLVRFEAALNDLVGFDGARDAECDPVVDDDCMPGCFDGARLQVDLIVRHRDHSVLLVRQEHARGTKDRVDIVASEDGVAIRGCGVDVDFPWNG